MAQIIGNPWSEMLVGTNAADRIDALAGNDIVHANGGSDTVFGRAGNDTLAGGTGNDALIGNTGNDTMHGGAGNDFMGWANGDGSDVMNGNAGHDTVGVTGSSSAGDSFTIGASGTRVDFNRVNLVPFSSTSARARCSGSTAGAATTPSWAATASTERSSSNSTAAPAGIS